MKGVGRDKNGKPMSHRQEPALSLDKNKCGKEAPNGTVISESRSRLTSAFKTKSKSINEKPHIDNSKTAAVHNDYEVNY